MKEELLQIFPTPLLIVPYKESIDKELAYLKTLVIVNNKVMVIIDQMIHTYYVMKSLKNKTFLTESVDKFTKNVLNSEQRLVITQCWANRNPTDPRS